jgi:hypothetical protein
VKGNDFDNSESVCENGIIVIENSLEAEGRLLMGSLFKRKHELFAARQLIFPLRQTAHEQPLPESAHGFVSISKSVSSPCKRQITELFLIMIQWQVRLERSKCGAWMSLEVQVKCQQL